MKYFLLILLFFTSIFLGAQVRDSLVSKANVYGTINGNSANHFINLGVDGFLLYGGELKASHRGLVATSNNFLIQHFDTAFGETLTRVSLGDNVGPTSLYVTDVAVYFLIKSSFSGSGTAELIRYDIKSHQYVRQVVHGGWTKSRELEFIVAGNYLYVKYERPENGGYGVIVYRPYLEAFDLGQKSIKGSDLTFNNYEGFALSDIRFIEPVNTMDTVLVQFYYNGDGKINTSEKMAFRLQGFYNGMMIMDGIVKGSAYKFRGPYVVGCGDRIDFWMVYPEEDSLRINYSYLMANSFTKVGSDVSSAVCLPKSLPGGWSITDLRSNSFLSVRQELDEDDFMRAKFNKPVRVTKFSEGNVVLDTTLTVFTEDEISTLPWPYYCFTNGSQNQFLVSSWQALYCYNINAENRLQVKYRLVMPMHVKIGSVDDNEGLSADARWSTVIRRRDLASKFDVQFAYDNFYYFFALSSPEDHRGITLRLYRCQF